MASNLRYARKLVDYGFVKAETVQVAFQVLHDQKSTQNQKIDKLFNIGFEFAGYVLNNYWHLKAYLAKKVDNFVKNKCSKYYIIGIQIRKQYVSVKQINLFSECALKIESEIRPLIKNQIVKWFISTDSTEILKELTRQFPDRLILNEGKIGHISFEPDSYERALMDLEMLSRCN